MGKIKTFFKKLNSASPATKAGFWFVVSNILLKGISFITTPIFTRLLEIADYGTTSVFVTWENVIGIFASLSLSGGVYNVAMTKHSDDIDRYTSSMLGLTLLSSVFVYIICIAINLFYPNLFELNTVFLLFMWLQNFTSACISFWLVRKRFLYDYKSVISYTFINAFLSPLIAIIAVTVFQNNKAFAKVIGAGVIGIIIGLCIFVNFLKKGKTLYNKNYWKFALKFNLPLLPHYLSSTILSSSDKLMINSIVSTAHAGIYSIAHSITGLLDIITHSINYALIPFTLQSIKQNNFKGLKKSINICTLLIAIICVLVTMFAREGVLIFASSKYLDAILFIPALSSAVLINFVVSIIGNILFYHEKTAQMSIITIVKAIVNVVLNYVCIKKWGYVAAGYTTLISSTLGFIIYYFVVKKYEPNFNKIVDVKLLILIFLMYGIIVVYSIIFAEVLLARIILIVAILITVCIFSKKIINFFKTMLSKKQEDSESENE